LCENGCAFGDALARAVERRSHPTGGEILACGELAERVGLSRLRRALRKWLRLGGCAGARAVERRSHPTGGEILACGELAERVGFEPTVGFPTAVFKTAAIDHSATSPKVCASAHFGP